MARLLECRAAEGERPRPLALAVARTRAEAVAGARGEASRRDLSRAAAAWHGWKGLVERLLLSRRAGLQLEPHARDGRAARHQAAAQQSQRVCGGAALGEPEGQQLQRRRGGGREDGLVPLGPLGGLELGQPLAAGRRALRAEAEAVGARRLEGGCLEERLAARVQVLKGDDMCVCEGRKARVELLT